MQISNYVFCENCKCSVHEWESYRWHADQGHALSWSTAHPASG